MDETTIEQAQTFGIMLCTKGFRLLDGLNACDAFGWSLSNDDGSDAFSIAGYAKQAFREERRRMA